MSQQLQIVWPDVLGWVVGKSFRAASISGKCAGAACWVIFKSLESRSSVWFSMVVKTDAAVNPSLLPSRWTQMCDMVKISAHSIYAPITCSVAKRRANTIYTCMSYQCISLYKLLAWKWFFYRNAMCFRIWYESAAGGYSLINIKHITGNLVQYFDSLPTWIYTSSFEAYLFHVITV